MITLRNERNIVNSKEGNENEREKYDNGSKSAEDDGKEIPIKERVRGRREERKKKIRKE
jgi:hypothetical protein